jgi:UDP-N-acetylglucosamine 1-carboxyvinyltransferase
MGIQVEETAGFIKCKCDKIRAADIHLDFPSVGATENVILAAVLADGITVINNAAMEPEIIDLANCLNRMGAKIQGAGTNVIRITGVRKLKGTGYKVMPDRIEAGTFLCAAAVTGGKVILNNVIPEHIVPVIHKLQEAGCEIDTEKNRIIINAPKKLKSIEIKTMPYPGFPTDLQQIFGATLSVAKGTSIIIENIFENRFKYTNELIRMGAKITVEGRTAIISGKRKLSGANVQGNDLRGGAALVIAGLAAKGKTRVDNIEYVLRGYEDLDDKLNMLGANIKEVGE